MPGLANRDSKQRAGEGVSSNSDVPGSVKQKLVSAYKSNLANKLRSEAQEIDDPPQDGLNDQKVARWATTWWQQFSVLLRRGVKERRYDSFSGLKIAQVLVVALLSGLLWWQSDVSHLQDQDSGASSLYSKLSSPSPKNVACSKRAIFRHVSTVIILHVKDWLKGTPGNFLQTLFVLLYSVLVSGGLGLALGALVLDQKSATILGSVIMLSFLLAGGYYVTHVPAFISWVKYISISQYTYKLLLGSQFRATDTYPCGGAAGGVCLVGDYPAIKQVGLDGQVLAAVALGIMLVVYRLIAYFALMRIGVTKK
ncbi:ABC TRANSPORTER G FAMILY MEMBER 21 [Salix purpurea]|uniref:ABC TRANSPORTER G FAMILY MEMBER 21 n=1 Tax=Salix purpurea TaxID=77065 RepID=A0A9Q0WPH4_SALPP|nr:ABC TRANSPORTER G FAMILY MEMBER 21 [Salix purpurea]